MAKKRTRNHTEPEGAAVRQRLADGGYRSVARRPPAPARRAAPAKLARTRKRRRSGLSEEPVVRVVQPRLETPDVGSVLRKGLRRTAYTGLFVEGLVAAHEDLVKSGHARVVRDAAGVRIEYLLDVAPVRTGRRGQSGGDGSEDAAKARAKLTLYSGLMDKVTGTVGFMFNQSAEFHALTLAGLVAAGGIATHVAHGDAMPVCRLTFISQLRERMGIPVFADFLKDLIQPRRIERGDIGVIG